MMDTTNEQMREQGRAIADRPAPTIIEAAAVLPDAEAAVTPVIHAEVEMPAVVRRVAGAGETALRQFTMALVAGLAERLDEIGGGAALAVKGRLH